MSDESADSKEITCIEGGEWKIEEYHRLLMAALTYQHDNTEGYYRKEIADEPSYK